MAQVSYHQKKVPIRIKPRRDAIYATQKKPYAHIYTSSSQAALVHLNIRDGSTFPLLFFTVSPGHWVNKADTQ